MICRSMNFIFLDGFKTCDNLFLYSGVSVLPWRPEVSVRRVCEAC